MQNQQCEHEYYRDNSGSDVRPAHVPTYWVVETCVVESEKTLH
jgi:hypothetical protein